MIPGVTDKLRPALDGVLGKLSTLGGLSPGQYSLPSVEVTKLGSSLSSTFTSLTEAMTGIKDAASVDAALPKLKDIDGQIDVAKAGFDKLPTTGKATIGAMVRAALEKLKQIVTRVLAIPGVGDKVKPVIDPIMTKLAALGG
jgi:hypothetical protein